MGTTSTLVHVDQCGTPLYNFRVSLFDGDDLLAFNITDENGDAELTFETALETIGELKLVVTGQSAWPQILDVMGLDGSEPFVYGDIISIENGALFGSQHWVTTELFNKGDVAAHLVHTSLTTDCEYITAYESNFIIDEMAPNSSETFEHGGLIDIADNIPDQTLFTLNLTTLSNETAESTTQLSFLALAPNLQFGTIEVEEIGGDGNGYVDPGEQAVLHISGKNSGHALAPNTHFTLNYTGGGVNINQTSYQIGEIEADGTFTVDVNLNTDSDIISGSTYHFDLCLQSGAYVTHLDYSFSVGIAVETFESGDFNFLSWEHAGDQHWFITDEEAHSGMYSARSGAIDDDEASYLLIYADILNDGEISFWFKTSTQSNKDYFAFFMDGRKKDWWSGQHDWTFARYGFEAGSHVFKWIYDKNKSGSSGQDCAWIDDITFPRSCYITKIEEVVKPSTNAVYPNPSNGNFTIELAEESNIGIFNMLGQNILSLSKVSGIQQLQLSEAGIYFIRISNANGVEVEKIVVK